jgi:hypothetical protein
MNTLTKILVVVSMVAGLGACGPDGGNATPSADAGAWSSVDAGGAATELFGNWTHATETDTCVCNDGSTLNNSTASTEPDTFAAGACGQVVITSALECSLTCQVSANAVTCAPGTCEYDGFTLETTSDVYTVANGQVVQETATGVMTLPSGTICQCTTTNGAFTRVP